MKKQSYFVPGKLYRLAQHWSGINYLEHMANAALLPIHTPRFHKGDILMFVRHITPEEMNHYNDFTNHDLWLAGDEKLYVFPRMFFGFHMWNKFL